MTKKSKPRVGKPHSAAPSKTYAPRVHRTEQQRRDAVLLFETRGTRTAAEVAAEVGCAPSQLYDWHASLGSQVAGKSGAESLEDEVKRLRREVSQVTRERDFLKKVHAFFVKDSL